MATSFKNKTFHLGITMAGAVSAGAYTAGFMDYLIEVLELWDKQKTIIKKKLSENKKLDEYEKKIPLHDVIIDAFGGASAGGMTGVITSLSTYAEMPPIRTLEDASITKKTGNILYDSWVLLDDDLDDDLNDKRGKKLTTFEKMFDNSDFEKSEDGVPSILNSRPIDKIADNVFDSIVEKTLKRARPNYISEDLRVLVTLCSLRGIPFEVEFKKLSSAHFAFSPGHRMNEHMIIAHFKTKWDESDKDVYLKFDPYDQTSKDLINLCTKATGAFPIGLAARHFEGKLTTAYIKNALMRSLEIDDDNIINLKINTENFDFTDIDGGTINNEPYTEVAQILQENNPNYNPEFPNFGTVMIDPFPNFYNQDEAKPVKSIFGDDLFQKNIWKVIPKAYSTFREQVRVKRSKTFYTNYFRLLIFPIKWMKIGKLVDHPPIACSALGGFGGFLDIEFRRHDFFLGRNNARNFLRSYCSLEFDKNNLHPLFKGVTKEMKEEFSWVPSKNNPEDKVYFPIIPDIKRIKESKSEKNPFEYTYKDFPEISNSYFKKIEPQLKHRVSGILKYEFNNNLKTKWFLRNALKLCRGFFAKKITKKVIKIIKEDLTNRSLLKEN